MEFDLFFEALMAATDPARFAETKARWLTQVSTSASPDSVKVAEELLGNPKLTAEDIDVSELVALGFVKVNADGTLCALFP